MNRLDKGQAVVLTTEEHIKAYFSEEYLKGYKAGQADERNKIRELVGDKENFENDAVFYLRLKELLETKS